MTLLDDPVVDDDVVEPELPAVLEPLTAEEAALAAILMDESGLDQAEFLLVDQSKPDLCYRAKPFQWSWWRNRDPRQFDQCIAAGQRVLTEHGWIPIEEVPVGALVLTHRGRWRSVIDKWCKGTQEVVKITGQGVAAESGLVVTADHRMYARRVRRASKPKDGHKGKKLLDAEWLAPADWEWNDGSGTMTANWATPTTVEPLPLPPQMVPVPGSHGPRIVDDVLTPEWMWLYGLWLAEGSSYNGQISTWSVNTSEVEKVGAALDAVRLPYAVARVGTEECFTFRVSSRAVTRWLVREGGHLAHGKRLGSWVYGAPADLRRAVFDGALYGDGHGHAKKQSHHAHAEIYTTVSEELALGMQLLGQTLGYSTSMWSREAGSCVTEGRTCATRKVWMLSFTLANEHQKAHTLIVDGVGWTAVKAIAPAGEAEVWDLTVDEDHSFVVKNRIARNCSRDVGKSERMMLRVLAFPFTHTGEEMSIFTPEFSHIDKISERIEMRIVTNWFYRSLTRPGRAGITHRPFKVLWANGSRLISSLPQRSGIGAKGTHSVEVHCEEAQDLSHQAWQEIPNTISWEKPGASWHIHGVSRGVRDDFYDYSTKPELGFTVHRITQMHREDWTEERRQQLIEEFGGSPDSPDYKRNVKGEHGDTANVIFILTNLMAGVDTDESSFYNLQEYQKYDVRGPEIQSRVEAMGGRAADAQVEESSDQHVMAVQQLLDFPKVHTERYEVFWAGMDVGLVDDPSEILVFAEYHPDGNERRANRAAKLAVPLDGRSRLKLLTRISIRWIPAPLQADIIMWVIDQYKPRAFSMDSTGNGLPVFQELQKRAGAERMRVMDYGDEKKIPIEATDSRTKKKQAARQALTAVKGYNFSGKVVIGFDEAQVEAMPAGATPQEIAQECGLQNWVKQASTDYLRGIVDTQRHLLPYDKELLRQWNAQTWQYGQGGVTPYGQRKTYSAVKVHTLDAARMMELGRELEPIEEFLREPPKKARPVFDHFIQGF